MNCSPLHFNELRSKSVEMVQQSDFETREARPGATAPLHCNFHLGSSRIVLRDPIFRDISGLSLAAKFDSKGKVRRSFPTYHIPLGPVEEIFSYLNIRDLSSVRSVSGRWKKVASDLLPKCLESSIDLNLFDVDAWATFYDRDDVGPRELPPSKEEIFKQFKCFRGTETRVSFSVVWIPPRLSLRAFVEVVNSKFNTVADGPRRISYVNPRVMEEIGDRILTEGYWFVSKDGLEEGRLGEVRQAHLERVGETGGELPELVALVVAMHAMVMKGKRLAEVQAGGCSNYARSVTKLSNGWSCVVGGLGPSSGLEVDYFWSVRNAHVGALSAWKF